MRVPRLRVILSAIAAAAAGASAQTPTRPNIVLIMADDMGFSDLGCYGSEIRTEQLDRLAAGGLRFTQFYNTARCCPTRAALMTGLYPHQAGVGHMMNDFGAPGYQGDLSTSCVTIAEVLREAGYATSMSGKWHVTRHTGWSDGEDADVQKHNWPPQRGFDDYLGTIHGAASYFNPVTLTRNNTPTEAEGDDYYYTDAISDHAAGFIAEHARDKPEQPFFLYVAYTAPHWPLHALPEDIERYRGRYDEGWDLLRAQRYRRMVDAGLIDARWELSPRDPAAPAWGDADHKAWQARRMEVYAAQIDRMDQGVGRIVQALEQAGAIDDTLILFLADNGGCAEELSSKGRGLHIPPRTRDGREVRRGNDPEIMPGPADTYQSYGLPWANASNTPFRLYKHWVHEGGISTPLIAHWPKGITRGGRLIREPGHVIDIMATCVDAAGAAYPETYKRRPITPLEGRSLLPILRGDRRPGHDAIYWEHEGNRAVRQGNWKLVSRHPGGWELFDLEADRTELHNLADVHPEKVRQLAAMYERWAARCSVEDWDELMKLRQLPKPELVSVQRIWDAAPHCAFTDLIRFQGRWYCTFREADDHAGGKIDGMLRVIVSDDGERWESAALLKEVGVDLRDPKLSVTPDDRLMIVAGGSVYDGKTLLARRPRVAFSPDGREWTPPQPILSEPHWLWRVTWHQGRAYGVSYYTRDGGRQGFLYTSTDGLDWEWVAELKVPGACETTLRFMPDGEMIALVRREGPGNLAWIGSSRPPYTEWDWHEAKYRVGGPEFIRLPDGALWAAGRRYDLPGGARTVLARMTRDRYDPLLTLPSGGDTSYPGMVWHDGLLWMSYYSSHEGKTSIYLAKINVQ